MLNPAEGTVRQNDSSSIRDELAKQRTRLALERTLLAYFRTGLAFLAVGVGAMQFADSRSDLVWTGWMFIGIGAGLFILGIKRFWTLRRLD